MARALVLPNARANAEQPERPLRQTQGRPNILWLVCEDISPYLGCYGDTQAETPNLDQLASAGVRFTRAYANAPVCAVARIGFYTGGNAARFRDEDLADKWVEKSEEWIKQNKDNPFFFYFASHDIHVPRMPLHLYYNVMREFPTTKSSNGIHSPIFGEIMLEACRKIGVECHLQYWEKDEGRPQPAVSRQAFINPLLLK